MIALEQTMFHLIHGMAGTSSILDRGLVFLTLYYPHLLVLLGLLWWSRGDRAARRLVLMAFGASALAYGLNYPLRQLFFRPRPFVVYGFEPLIEYAAEKSSFPSNHTAAAFAFGYFIAFRHRRWGLYLAVSAVVLGLARVFVGVHHPGDIAAGILIGMLAAWVVWRAERKMTRAQAEE